MTFDKLICCIQEDMERNKRFDGDLVEITEEAMIPSHPSYRHLDSVLSVINGDGIKSGDFERNLLDALQVAVSLDSDGRETRNAAFDDMTGMENVAKTINSLLDVNGGQPAAAKIMLVRKIVIGSGGARVPVLHFNDTSIKNFQTMVAKGPITDPKELQKIIKTGGDLSNSGIGNVSEPNFDESIRNGQDRWICGSPKMYLRYIKGLYTTSSVSLGLTVNWSFFKGLYPASLSDLSTMFCDFVRTGRVNPEIVSSRLRIDGSKAGRSVSASIVDPKWKPEIRPDGTYNLANPKMKDISSEQANASFKILGKCAALSEGSAYLENGQYLTQLLDSDEKCFERYFKELAGNSDLHTAICETNGIDVNPMDWDDFCNNAPKAIYDGAINEDVFMNLLAGFVETLKFRTVDGLLQRFNGANTFNYYVYTLQDGASPSGDTAYLLNHYPPGESDWPNSTVSNLLRTTDRTRTMGDRFRNLIGRDAGTRIGGSAGAAIKF